MFNVNKKNYTPYYVIKKIKLKIGKNLINRFYN